MVKSAAKKKVDDKPSDPIIEAFKKIKELRKQKDNARYENNDELGSALRQAVADAVKADYSLTSVAKQTGISYPTLKKFSEGDAGGKGRSLSVDNRAKGISLYDKYSDSIDKLVEARSLVDSEAYKLLQKLLVSENGSLSDVKEMLDTAIKWSKIESEK